MNTTMKNNASIMAHVQQNHHNGLAQDSGNSSAAEMKVPQFLQRA